MLMVCILLTLVVRGPFLTSVCDVHTRLRVHSCNARAPVLRCHARLHAPFLTSLCLLDQLAWLQAIR
jgi:hypothetical protein